MILSAADFEIASRNGSRVACLPQIDENWCLVVKVDSATGFLGDEYGKEVFFATLDDAIAPVSYTHLTLPTTERV